MNVSIDYDGIEELFAEAHAEGRPSLFEYETYELMRIIGSETPPKCFLIPRNTKVIDEEVLSFPGEKVVLKIVSPSIVHKTEVGGVRIVPKEPDKVRSAVRRMLYEVPTRYAEQLSAMPESTPAPYRGLSGTALQQAIAADLRGVLQVQFIPPDSSAFGNELIVGLRRTREFGMVVSAGLGGTDTELFARHFRKGRAVVAALTGQVDGEAFFELFKKTLSYKKLAGLTRGQSRMVTDEQLVECFEAMIRLGNHFSPANPHARFFIEELEINPFTFTDYLMVPLDGMCRFSVRRALPAPRPIHFIDRLLHPASIGIVGVSASRKNFGRIILDNILQSGFDREALTLIREGEARDMSGVPCVPDFAALPAPLDLLIVAVGAGQVPALVNDILEQRAAHSVMLIPGGLGETEESRDMAARMMERIEAAHGKGDGGPVFIGANCMGIVSHPGRYNTWFIPEEKYRVSLRADCRRTAVISQSGAFLLFRTSQRPEMDPAYLISMGNQTDLTLGDMMRHFSASREVDVIAVYAEGFKDGDGLNFADAAREAARRGKQVVFYKAGRTPEGKKATNGHTASVAGDYMVCESALRQAGAIVARTFGEFQDLVIMAERFHGFTIRGNRLGAISGAGFEAVGMADFIHADEYSMALGLCSEATRQAMRAVVRAKKLESLVSIGNPLDINPSADDEVHIRMAELMLADEHIDALVVSMTPLSPLTHTLDTDTPAFDMRAPGGLLEGFTALAAHAEKPLVAVVDGGGLFEPFRDALRRNGIPVFERCDLAMSALSLYMEARLGRRADVLSGMVEPFLNGK